MHTKINTTSALKDSEHAGRGQARRFTSKATARIVGVLYIIGTVAGILSLGPLSPLDAADLLPAVADGADRVMP